MVLDYIQNIMDRSAALEIHVHPVPFSATQDFTILLKQVLSRAGEALGDDYLSSLLRPVRGYAYKLAQMPLPLNHPELYPAQGLEQFRAEQKRLVQSYPSLASVIDDLLESLELLSIADDAPLLEKILHLDAHQPAAVLVDDARSAAVLSRYLESIQETNLCVVTSKNLRELASYATLVVAGPISRHPGYVLLSPRTFRVEIVRYDWTYDIVEIQHTFAESVKPRELKVKTIQPVQKSGAVPEPRSEFPLINLEELRPSIDVAMLARRERGNYEHELVKARLIVLEADYGVFLEEDSTTFLVKPEFPLTERVSRCEVARLSGGDFVVLRTEGGGDYVTEVADHLLGHRAKIFRERQTTWKTQLRRCVVAKGIADVERELVRAGITSASSVNIRNWTSAKNLGMHQLKDFEVMLGFLGLSNDADLYKDALVALRRAHQSAGHQIRRQLIDRLTNLDPVALKQQGHLDIQLEDAVGGRFSIYRIVSLPEGSVDIPEGRLGDLVSLI